jgi:hypothetical protein
MNIIPPISEGQCPSCACRLACWMRARFNDVDIISSVTCALSSSLVGGVSSWRCFCFEHCNGLKLNIDSLTVVYQKYWKYGAHNLQWNLKKKVQNRVHKTYNMLVCHVDNRYCIIIYFFLCLWGPLCRNGNGEKDSATRKGETYSLRKTERLSCPGCAQQRSEKHTVDSCRAFFVMWRTTNAAKVHLLHNLWPIILFLSSFPLDDSLK